MVICRLNASRVSTNSLIRNSMNLENITGILEETGQNWTKQNVKTQIRDKERYYNIDSREEMDK